jgi:hypothetical protein
MYYLNLSNDRSRIRCHEQFAKMINQQLVSPYDDPGPMANIRYRETGENLEREKCTIRPETSPHKI